MFGRTISQRIKNFDVYGKMPKDLSEGTMSGALISIISVSIMIILIFSELLRLFSYQTITEMHVEHGQTGQKINVNLDMILHRFPCQLLSVDVMDVMGKHQMHYGRNLLRNRLDSNGNLLEKDIRIKDHNLFNDGYDHSDDIDKKALIKQLKNHEGCWLKGTIELNKVPGNFHISSHAFQRILQELFQGGHIQTLDLQHTINHLSFGDENDVKQMKNTISQESISPLDGHKAQIHANSPGFFFEYYMSVVPTTFIQFNGNQINLHQLTVNQNDFQSHMLPAIFFRFDLSPISVTIQYKRERIVEFLVQLCAIVGGVFTVSGIIDTIIHKSLIKILKKVQMGKLN